MSNLSVYETAIRATAMYTFSIYTGGYYSKLIGNRGSFTSIAMTVPFIRRRLFEDARRTGYNIFS